MSDSNKATSASSLVEKIAKLQEATDTAKADVDQKQLELADSQKRLDVAKELLQSLEPEQQQSIAINDTKYPDLLALHQIAKDNYETAQKRYETNQKYLDKYKAMMMADAG